MTGLGGGGVGGRWPDALARVAISTSYFSGPPSLISSRIVLSGCGGGGGGGVEERERGRDFDDFGFGPVPAVEGGFESAAEAESFIFLEGGGFASWLVSGASVRASLAEGGPGELSRLLRMITSLGAEIAELWLEREDGGGSSGDSKVTTTLLFASSFIATSSGMTARKLLEGGEEEMVLGWRMPKKECCTSTCPLSQHLSAIFFSLLFDAVDLELLGGSVQNYD